MDLDDTLGLVLERLDSQATLIRAASTCKRWRSFIADPAFLRRFRSRHRHARAVVAGDYFMLSSPFRHLALGLEPPAGRTGALFVPSSPAIDAGRYSLDFLAGAGVERWTVVDSRGTLLLLHCTLPWHHPGDGFTPDLVVCEPHTQSCKRILPPPDTSVDNFMFWGSYLVDGDAADDVGDRISMSNFRVLCELSRRSDGVNVTAMFTGGATDSSSSWGEKKAAVDVAPPWPLLRLMGRAAGKWYFYFQSRKMIVFDGSTGEFSSSMLPPIVDWDLHIWHFKFYVTEGRDRKPRVFTVFDDTMKVLAMMDDDGGEWAPEKTVLLSEATRGLPGYKPSFFNQPLNILTRAPGFVILSTRTEDWWTFSIDLETMEAALAPAEEDLGAMAYPCELPWPPPFHACLDQ
ncbi:hypothetical protein EJB05_00766, partial [Eragrostis curvula]